MNQRSKVTDTRMKLTILKLQFTKVQGVFQSRRISLTMSALSLILSPQHIQINVSMLEIGALAQNNQLLLARCVLLSRCYQNPLLLCLLPLIGRKAPERQDAKVNTHSWRLFVFVGTELLLLCWNVHQYVQTMERNGTITGYPSQLQTWVAEFTTSSSDLEQLSNMWVHYVGKGFAHLLELLTHSACLSTYYEPSLGIRWYLDAQMLPEYKLYFEVLFLLQPVICAGLIYHYIAPKCPTVAVHIMVVIILLFSRGLVALDVVFSVVLLCQHQEVIGGVRNVPYIVAGIAVPLAVSPLMCSLWVDRGTGNANYFFFQGICLWLFCALGIVEFTGSFMRSVNAIK